MSLNQPQEKIDLDLTCKPKPLETGYDVPSEGHFTLWPKVERPSISTNQIARHQEFGLSTLRTKVKVQKPSQFKMLTFWRRGDNLSKEVWVGREWKPKLWLRGCRFFSLNKQSLTRSWPLHSRGYFEQGIKWHASLSLDFGLDLWRLHTMAVQFERPWEFMAKGLDFGLGLWRLHTMPGRRLHLLYFIGYLFSAHFFGLSTKCGHSIPRPLDFNGHSVKRPQVPTQLS